MYIIVFELKFNLIKTLRFTTIDVDDKQLDQRQIVDPVWLMSEYKTQLFKLEDAIQFHKEMAQPAMLNNLDGFMHVRLVLDMTTKKKVFVLIFCDFFSKIILFFIMIIRVNSWIT